MWEKFSSSSSLYAHISRHVITHDNRATCILHEGIWKHKWLLGSLPQGSYWRNYEVGYQLFEHCINVFWGTLVHSRTNFQEKSESEKSAPSTDNGIDLEAVGFLRKVRIFARSCWKSIHWCCAALLKLSRNSRTQAFWSKNNIRMQKYFTRTIYCTVIYFLLIRLIDTKIVFK
jgi:hypothetical protein